MGGVDIEEVAATTPEKIARMHMDPAWGPWDFQIRDLIDRAELDKQASREIASVIKKLYQVFLTSDASLAEINPLVVTGDGKVIAADGKFDVDDNALFRQKELLKYREVSEADPIEAEAARRGVPYVRLDGDIGIIGNGAGLVMTTLDIVTRNGGKPANFLDLGGGAKAETVRQRPGDRAVEPQRQGRAVQHLRRHRSGRRGGQGDHRGHPDHGDQGAHSGAHVRHPGGRGAGDTEGHQPDPGGHGAGSRPEDHRAWLGRS